MKQDIYILYNQDSKSVSQKISDSTGGKLLYSESFELDIKQLIEIKKTCSTDYFYLIKSHKEINFQNFDFTFVPSEWEKDYVHIWKDEYVRLLNLSNLLKNAEYYTDQNLKDGKIKIKYHNEKIHSYPVYDIYFLSYDEMYANENFDRLKDRFPRIKRLDKIEGIYNAHRSAAEWAKYNNSDMFYVIDADADVVESFNFDYTPSFYDANSVHIWHARNAVNDLEYGYGGIKLFPTDRLLSYTGSPIDFTTSIGSVKVIPEVSNITRFNTDPFTAWRSGFRECTKLSSRLINNQDNEETLRRLDIWCSIGHNREYGDFTIMGANEGREFGTMHQNDTEMLKLINNYKWLEEKFNDS